MPSGRFKVLKCILKKVNGDFTVFARIRNGKREAFQNRTYKKIKSEKETPTSTSWVSDPNDPNNVKIEAAIRRAAKKPTGELTKADLEKVTKLILFSKKLTDVKGLEKLTQLTSLNLEKNQLTDVKGLEKLTQLTILNLWDNKLTDVKELEKLNQLTWLQLNENKLTSVKGLEKLTQLEKLYLKDNQLTNVKGLEKLTQLKNLGLHSNQLTDLKGLEKLTQLTSLELRQNRDLTKAQIAELQKALPKCRIYSNPKK
jgi:Leucine-rich repeat (LRR) protein